MFVFLRHFSKITAKGPSSSLISESNLSKYRYDDRILKKRPTQYTVHPMFVNRTSFKTMTGESLTDDEIGSLLEAARWAPSHFNTQPWRFIYVRRNSQRWKDCLHMLWEPNRMWAKNAGVIMVAISHPYISVNGVIREMPNAVFGLSAAIENMLLEACSRGWVAHALAGYYRDRVYQKFQLDKNKHHVEVMLAFGKKKPEQLDDIAPRNPIGDVAAEGRYPGKDYKFDMFWVLLGWIQRRVKRWFV